MDIRKSLPGIIGFVAALGIGLAAQVISPAPAPPETVPLTKSIVGLWRGDALYLDTRTTFGRAEIEMRFNDYGTVTVRRGPYLGRPRGDSFTGDYVVVGNGVLISPHQVPGLLSIPGIAIDGDKWESLATSAGVSDTFIGSALMMKRQ